MGRQRLTAGEEQASAAAERDLVDPTDDALLLAATRIPAELAAGLGRVDPASRARAIQRLQAGIGNGAMGELLANRDPAVARPTVQRDDGALGDSGPQPLDAATGGGATETIGPPVPTSYAVTASSLAEVEAAISGRDEAGYVGWVENMSSSALTGPTVDTVSVNVDISLEMPSWTPPSKMLPKARAEWTRWYAALAAHEQGHIKLVHDVHDGISKKILGKPPKEGETLFNNAKASLKTKSKAYDANTGHGLKTGTVLDVGIEQKELDEEQKKKDEAAKAKTRDSAVPDVPDEE